MFQIYQQSDGMWVCQGQGYMGMSLDRDRAVTMWWTAYRRK